jgi:hypothetical protein
MGSGEVNIACYADVIAVIAEQSMIYRDCIITLISVA